MTSLPVALYIPNLLCYARIVFAFVGLHFCDSSPVSAVLCWIFAAILDLFDGMLARKLNQCSSLGVLVDIMADNILRTIVWLAAAIQEPSSYRLVAALVICLEWTTMVCTQLQAAQSDSHWKQQQASPKQKEPWWFVQKIFENNFKTPFGTICIYGLFSASMFAYATPHSILVESIPFFVYWKYAAYFGRACTSIAELWLCQSYLSLVIEKDMQAKTKTP